MPESGGQQVLKEIPGRPALRAPTPHTRARANTRACTARLECAVSGRWGNSKHSLSPGLAFSHGL